MRTAKNGFCLLEPSFGLLQVKSEQLDQDVRPRRPDGVGRHGGGGSVHRINCEPGRRTVTAVAQWWQPRKEGPRLRDPGCQT